MYSANDIVNYQPSKNHLKDRVILITGAGDGIGKEAAIAFAKAGATVILAGRTPAKLDAVYNFIMTLECPEPCIFAIDLEGASHDDYVNLAASIDEQFGRLDGLLHNAGILDSVPL